MKKIYLSLFAIALTIGAMAQSTVTIGTNTLPPGSAPAGGGSTNTYRSPWSPTWGYSYTQTIYLQPEINTAGNITTLSFDYHGSTLDKSDQITVWLGHITRGVFASTADWEPVGNLTQVFTGTPTYGALPGPVTVTLTTPFAYNNTQNLLLAVHEFEPDFNASGYFYATEMNSGARTIYRVDDDNNPDPAAPPAGDAIRTKVGNVRISFAPSMPVTLSSFTGEKAGSSNKLSWTTQTESNNRGFELQRSADGTNFSSVGFVASKAEKGNSTSSLTYNYNDAANGTAYYRLKQVDLDGKSNFSKVVVVKGSNARFALGAIYPNPVKNNLSLVVTAPVADRATIFISDISGKIVSTTASNVLAGDNKINVDPSRFAPGVYNVKIVFTNANESVGGKFVKQ